MTPLSKCFVFYFKYQPEMLHWYWKEQQQEGDNDPEILKMVKAIGDQCCDDVVNFLNECVTIAEKHFVANGKKFAKKNPSPKKWSVSCGVWQGTAPRNENWKMRIGVDIPKTKSEIIPWVWGFGRDETEYRMIQEFGNTVIRSSEVDMQSGRVALARIPIHPETFDGSEIDLKPLLEQVKKSFEPITATKFENVYNFIKNLPS